MDTKYECVHTKGNFKRSEYSDRMGSGVVQPAQDPIRSAIPNDTHAVQPMNGFYDRELSDQGTGIGLPPHHHQNQPSGTIIAWGINTDGQCDVPANLTNAVDVVAGLITALRSRMTAPSSIGGVFIGRMNAEPRLDL